MNRTIASGFPLVAIGAALVTAAIPVRWLHEQSMVDNCLSGKHGSFDYNRMSCDQNDNHSYVPYGIRHPHDAYIALVASLIFALCLFGYYLSRRGGAGDALKRPMGSR